MTFKKINVDELEFSPTKAIGENWGILTGTAESGFNSMTVSWGSVGVLWNKPCVFAFVRPVRYTYEFMEQGEYFSLAIMPEGIHEKMAVFGSKSGRDVDKYKESGFTVLDEDGVKYPEEAETVFICKKIAAGDIKPEWFIDETIDGKNYPKKDYHRMYIGEILTVLKKD
ncbi:MAG: flavin reductase family protein [Clostridia bacterium]|nr:flavin reductase family protein [Clostridia bacterium]